MFEECIKAVDEGRRKCVKYTYGSTGPQEAAKLLQKIGYEKSVDYEEKW